MPEPTADAIDSLAYSTRHSRATLEAAAKALGTYATGANLRAVVKVADALDWDLVLVAETVVGEGVTS